MSKWSGPSAAKQRSSCAERGRAPKASEPPAQVLCTSLALPNQLTPNFEAQKIDGILVTRLPASRLEGFGGVRV